VPEFTVPAPSSVPQNMLPAPSVSSAPVPVQDPIDAIVTPPAPTHSPPSKVEVAVELDVSLPVMVNAPSTVEDASDRKPPSRVERPDTAREEEAESAPSTFRFAVKVEEA
jgi:hypothetical protein